MGDDGIRNEFLKEGGEVVVAWTEIPFNEVREEEYVPKAWGGGGGGGGGGGDSVLLEKGDIGRI